MRLIDVGCGPGTITLGLAELVAPGEVVGIDFQARQIVQARALSADCGPANVRFEVGDVYRLPFADQSFDEVFANAVLKHLRDPGRALAELQRVLCPGGIGGVRDSDFGSVLFAPETPVLEQWRALFMRALKHNGGAPFVGRHHRRLLLEARFVGAEASASVDSAGSPE